MGYCSDVKLIVAFPSERLRDEALALWSMLEGVRESSVLEELEMRETEYENPDNELMNIYLITWHNDYVKWYTDHPQRVALDALRNLLSEQVKARTEFCYAWRLARTGEEIDDIEIEHDYESNGDTVDDYVDRTSYHLSDYLFEALPVTVTTSFEIKQVELT